MLDNIGMILIDSTLAAKSEVNPRDATERLIAMWQHRIEQLGCQV